MSFLDMYVEWREELMIKEQHQQADDREDEEENRALGIDTSDALRVTKEEIDEDYETLDLSQFDKHAD